MPAVDLVDETFVVADRAELARIVADPARWRAWWPDLELSVFMDRGFDGIRWSVSGRWAGSMEIWLEPVLDGVLVHHYVRLDPADRAGDAAAPGPAARRRAARERARRARAWKRAVWELKDGLEAGRAPGEPRPLGPAPAEPSGGPAAAGDAHPDGGGAGPAAPRA